MSCFLRWKIHPLPGRSATPTGFGDVSVIPRPTLSVSSRPPLRRYSQPPPIFVFSHTPPPSPPTPKKTYPGRAYLFDQCVNISTGPAEDRILITGLHTVSDISCKRCRTLVGWTYAKAYENSQKYKEGKFIIEKIHLHLEENDVYYDVGRPAGERGDRWRVRSMSWGSERSTSAGSYGEATTTPVSSYSSSPSTTGGLYSRSRSGSGSGYLGGNNVPSTFDHPRPSPQTPVRRSPGATAAATLTPNSPSLPGDVIYEYR